MCCVQVVPTEHILRCTMWCTRSKAVFVMVLDAKRKKTRSTTNVGIKWPTVCSRCPCPCSSCAVTFNIHLCWALQYEAQESSQLWAYEVESSCLSQAAPGPATWVST